MPGAGEGRHGWNELNTENRGDRLAVVSTAAVI